MTAGSVDDGKSTLIGRLLFDSAAIYQDQLDSVRELSREGLDLSLITDGLRAEREQGITIDVAYRYFTTPKRRFIIADTPGHQQYTRNMATGASTADAAVILVDATRGVLLQTRRHAYLAWLFGIRHVVVTINKMDLVNFEEAVFERIRQEFCRFANELRGCSFSYIPVCATEGDNVVRQSAAMPWFTGGTLVEQLENVDLLALKSDSAFRLPIQYIIRSDGRPRAYAGQISSGTVQRGDRVIVLPSEQHTRVSTIPTYDGLLDRAVAPMSVSVGLADELDVGRGDMLVAESASPAVSTRWYATVVWMSEDPMQIGRPYLLKHTSQRVCAQISRLVSKLDFNSLQFCQADEVELNDIANVELETHRPIFADAYNENRTTGSFILIEPVTNSTIAAGMIISPRASTACERQNDAATATGLTVWFTGLSSAGKTTLCTAVYEELWGFGYRVQVLDGDEVRRHLCNDLGFTKSDRDENVRRIGFVADLLTRAGVVVLVSAISPYRAVRDEVREKIGSFVEVYVNAPLAVCEQRDVKGLYRKARLGQIPGFTGITDPYESPTSPDVECFTGRESLAESTEKVMRVVASRLSCTLQDAAVRVLRHSSLR